MATSVIDPGGGEDYTTLAAWETAYDGNATTKQAALVQGTGDVGPLTMDGWTGTNDSNNYPIVYTLSAIRDGTITRNSVYSNGVDAAALVFDIHVPFARIEGQSLYANDDGVGSTGVTTNVAKLRADSITFESNMVVANNSITSGAIYAVIEHS